MGCLSIVTHLTTEQIKGRLYGCTNGHHASYWQIILPLSLNPGRKPFEYAALLGCGERKLYRIGSLYNRQGADFIEKLQRGGRREKRCVMSFEQEAALLENWTTTALEAKVLVAKRLRKAVEEKTGHAVSTDYLWDMLHRHGWTEKAPRPQHPEAAEGKAKREAFKKKPLPSL